MKAGVHDRRSASVEDCSHGRPSTEEVWRRGRGHARKSASAEEDRCGGGPSVEPALRRPQHGGRHGGLHGGGV
jgi:hypothetical protein